MRALTRISDAGLGSEVEPQIHKNFDDRYQPKARGHDPVDVLPRARLGALDPDALPKAREAFQQGQAPDAILREVWRARRGSNRTRIRVALAVGAWLERSSRFREAGAACGLAARLAGQCAGDEARELELEARCRAGLALFEAREVSGAWQHLRRAEALLQARGEGFQGIDAFRLGILAALNGEQELAARYFARVPSRDHRSAARTLNR